MIQHLRAIYEDGVLRPVDPLLLPEKHEVQLVVSDECPLPQVRFVPAEEYAPYADDSVTLAQVRQSLSKIRGSLAEDFAAERSERS